MSDQHTCHVPGCAKEVPRRLLMCNRHWRFVSTATQQKVYRLYRAGQEEGKVQPSRLWFDAADQAIAEAMASDLTLRRRRVHVHGA